MSKTIEEHERENASLRTDLSNAMVLALDHDVHSRALAKALDDAISTYRQDGKTVLVSAERQEAWLQALTNYRAAFGVPPQT